MTASLCHRVSDRHIAQAARDGCAGFEELQHELCVVTACSACHDCARNAFHEHACVAASAAAVGAGSVQTPAAHVAVIQRLVAAQAVGA